MNNTAVDYFDHPVFHPIELRLNTKAMEKLEENISQWIWTGCTGGLISGESRTGKTISVLDLEKQLYTRGNILIPYFYFSIPSRDIKTITSVFRGLCLQQELRETSRDRADHLADRYVHYIADKCVESNCYQAIQIVDEMQRLKAEQFNAFAELYDKLLLLGISLTVVFVGNDPECWKLVETLEQKHYAHIHGRFFRQGYVFKGMVSKDEVKKCLEQYDTLCFPKNGPTYTEYFLPEAVKKGWKISSLSDVLWRIFREYQKIYDIKSWGMQYFTVTVNNLLTDYLPLNGVDDIDDEMIKACIDISGIIPSLVRPIK